MARSTSDGRRILLHAVTEPEFQDWVLRVAERGGWCAFHILRSDDVTMGVHTLRNSDHLDSHGWPDLVLARDGVVLYRELKTDDGRLSRHQKRWGRTLPNWDVWRPSDEERILAELE